MNLVLTSTLLLLIGVFLGPGTGVLDRQTLRALAPLSALLLGWLGAAFGIRFDRRFLTRLHAPVVREAAVQAGASFVAVAITGWILTRMVPALAAALSPRSTTILVLAATAATAGPGVLARLVDGTSARWSFVSTAILEAQVASGLGVVAVAVVLAGLGPAPSGPRGGPGAVLWLVLTLGSGLLIGLLYLSVTRVRHTPSDLTIALCGTLLLGAGTGAAAGGGRGVAPFLICAIGGVVIGHLSPHRGPIRDLLGRWEVVAAAGLLVLAGALATMPTAWLVPGALLLHAARAGARWGAGRAAGAPGEGLTGVPQGAVALALGVSVAPLAGGAVLTVIAIGVVATQLAAPALLARALRPVPLTPAAPAAEVTP